jgi:hypothetical protein
MIGDGPLSHAGDSMTRPLVIVFTKVAILLLLLPILWADLVLMTVAIPIFERAPFLHSAALVGCVAAIVSLVVRSLTPMVWAALWVAYAGAFFTLNIYAVAAVGLSMLVAAVSFIYRNKFTEPLLVLLPVFAGAFLFVTLVYDAYLPAWIRFVTGHLGLGNAVLMALNEAARQYIPLALTVPIFGMYFLGKHGYTKLAPYFVRGSLKG